MIILIVLVGALIACVVYYFVHVFSYAAYSVVTVESPGIDFKKDFAIGEISVLRDVLRDLHISIPQSHEMRILNCFIELSLVMKLFH